MNFNKVIICGRVTKDIELKKTNEGRAVVSLVLATNNTYVDKNNNKVDKADFHNIVMWGTMADTVAKYCLKGSVLLVE
jgi:single-strand DNA-binding protein